MKWPLSLILSVAVLLSSCAATPAPPSTQLIEQTKSSLVRLEHQNGRGLDICTGMIVAPGQILTARHCAVEGMTAHGIPIRLIRETDSLALYSVSALLGPPVQFRIEPLHYGDEVIAMGYGYGFFFTFTRHVASPLYDETEVVLDGLVVHGTSGGPVIDLEGKVVGIVQYIYADTLTILCGQDEIRKFLKK